MADHPNLKVESNEVIDHTAPLWVFFLIAGSIFVFAMYIGTTGREWDRNPFYPISALIASAVISGPICAMISSIMLWNFRRKKKNNR